MERLLTKVEQRLTEISSIISLTRKADKENDWEDIAVLMDLAEDLIRETRGDVTIKLLEITTQA